MGKPRTQKQLANDQRMREMALARAGQRTGTDPRTTRTQESREANPAREQENTPWVQGGSLEAPKARPGYTQRWIRVSSKGKDDAINISKKFREGWKPRPADTVPAHYQTAKIEHGRYAGFIGVEGMVLCELPIARAKARKQYIRDQTDKKTKAIDAELERANKANRGPGFGEIQKSARTIPVREVRVQQEDGEAAEVD